MLALDAGMIRDLYGFGDPASKSLLFVLVFPVL
jgi:hypothetical protein